MKLLLDQNLSPRIAAALSDVFPGSMHVRDAGLASRTDIEVWRYAAANGFCVVSKDSDFHQLSFLHGPPPKVVWIRRGNCTTKEIENLLRQSAAAIAQFGEDEESAFLSIS